MLRRWIKSAAAHALCRSNADRWIFSLAGYKNMPLILGYHRVVERFAADEQNTIPSMLISLAMLERHLDWVGRRYRFVSLDEIGAILQSGPTSAKPAAVVTFDDGYRDFYDLAFPLLKRKGIPAGVFVVTDLIGTRRMQVHDRLYLGLAKIFSPSRHAERTVNAALQRLGIRHPAIEDHMRRASNIAFALTRSLLETLPQGEILRLAGELESETDIGEGAPNALAPLTWEMLAELHRAGITIASHTQTHAFLTNESRQRVIQEVAGSRELLRRKLGITAEHFAYPDGRFDDISVFAVAEAGYRFAYTTCLHRDLSQPLLTIPRKVLWENSCLDVKGSFSPDILSCQVNRTFDFIARGCEGKHTRPAANDLYSSTHSCEATAQ